MKPDAFSFLFFFVVLYVCVCTVVCTRICMFCYLEGVSVSQCLALFLFVLVAMSSS